MSTDALETTAAREAQRVLPCVLKDTAMLIDGHSAAGRKLLLQTWQVCYDCPQGNPDPSCPGYRPKPIGQY